MNERVVPHYASRWNVAVFSSGLKTCSGKMDMDATQEKLRNQEYEIGYTSFNLLKSRVTLKAIKYQICSNCTWKSKYLSREAVTDDVNVGIHTIADEYAVKTSSFLQILFHAVWLKYRKETKALSYTTISNKISAFSLREDSYDDPLLN